MDYDMITIGLLGDRPLTYELFLDVLETLASLGASDEVMRLSDASPSSR